MNTARLNKYTPRASQEDVPGMEDMTRYSYISKNNSNNNSNSNGNKYTRSSNARSQKTPSSSVAAIPASSSSPPIQSTSALEDIVEKAKSKSKSKITRPADSRNNGIKNIIDSRNNDLLKYTNIPLSLPSPAPIFPSSFPSSTSSGKKTYAETVKMISLKPDINTKRCYTCKPRGKVMMHIISTSPCGNFLFNHDMNNRPIILVTPIMHVETVEELPVDLQINLFKSISDFCKFWSIDSYEVSYNVGEWQKNSHMHIKIKLKEKHINRMRGDHFRLLKLKQQYDTR